MSDEHSFWEELRKRRVVRVAVVYAVVGWSVFEGSLPLTEALALPDFTPRLILGLVVLGFPVALALTWALQVTPEGIRKEAPFTPGGMSSRLPLLGGLAIGVVALGALALSLLPDRGPAGPGLDGAATEELVVVMPFRVGGVPEDLSYLGVGFQELVYTALDGAVGPRALEPSTVNAVDVGRTPDATLVARRLGAPWVVTGSVVGSGSNVVVTAVMEDTAGTRREIADAEGHPDSLASLAQELVGRLLPLVQGEYPESLDHLLRTSPPARVEYLRGKEAWRSGAWYDAAESFGRAMDMDTTFALAALWHANARNMAIGVDSRGDLERAWRYRDRLSRRDRMYVEALWSDQPRSWAEELEDLEELTRELPDRIEAWYMLGESRVHSRKDRPPDWPRGASRIFRTALELNPRYFPAMEHLIISELAYADAETLQVLATAYSEMRVNPLYGGLAAGTGRLVLDTVALADPETDPNWVHFAPQAPIVWPDRAPDDLGPAVDAALRVLRSKVGTASILTPGAAARIEYDTQVALGRPGRAQRALDRVYAPTDRDILHFALWDGTFTEHAEGAARVIDGQWPASSVLDVDAARDLFASEVWTFMTDPDHAATETAERLRSAAEGLSSPSSDELEARALLLEAWAWARSGDPAAASDNMDQVDDLIAEGPGGLGRFFLLSTARVYEELDLPSRALHTLERRSYVVTGSETRHEVEILRRMGTYAAAAGDATRALQEYRRYLVLRHDPDPSLADEVESVRAEVARLEDGGA